MFMKVMRGLAHNGDYLSDDDIDSIAEEADDDGNGEIDAHEFHHLLQRYHLSRYE